MAGEQLLLVMLQQIMVFMFATTLALRNRRRIRVQQRRRMRRMYREGQYMGLNPAFVAAALVLLQTRHVDRHIGAYPRSSEWWQAIAIETFDDAQWYKRFRMRRNTFALILNDVNDVLRRTDTHMRTAITAEKRLAIGVYWLASGDLMRTVGDLFGVSEGSVSNIVYEVCNAIVDNLGRYLSFPRGQRLRETIQGYEQEWQFPQCGGAVDGSHIHIKCPSSDERTDFYNRKGWYSMVLQGIVDFAYRYVLHLWG
ncbi:protein ANTAGONIST OF LIKE HETEROCHROMATIN PROTEIN 1-like [Branchiostoma floridae]|uniref:Protein ANTAGONIST OF LIKE HETEROCHROMATIN PROTEIN 1-like n=1 Tax=Branchiostoma floridae TaxID=7739 RepID=A0A9J7MT55_BRAFL|nr:protein ANTAGONIST OF LIKE HETEROCHROMATIN PROTEIN 1-like [Branchiostoma floridae]